MMNNGRVLLFWLANRFSFEINKPLENVINIKLLVKTVINAEKWYINNKKD